jgi:hypothetical protein
LVEGVEASAGMTKRLPRTFDEVVAATDPDVRERMERAELYRMGAVMRRPFASCFELNL